MAFRFSHSLQIGVEDMEEKYMDQKHGLSLPSYPAPFNHMCPTTLPMAIGSHEAWGKPCFLMSHRESCPPPPVKDKKNTKTETLSPPSDPESPSATSVSAVAVASASTINGGGAAGVSVVQPKPASDLEMKWGRNIDPNMDPKKLRRILSNRISAQKSRLKKIQYINDMERKAKDLQAEIAMLSPRVAYQEHQFKLLKMEKGILQQQLDDCSERSNLSFVQMVEHQAEVKRLKEALMTQKDQIQKQDDDDYHELMMVSWKHEAAGSQAMEGSMNSNQEGFDQILNFNSLTIDPPRSLI